MATIQKRGGRWRAMVCRRGHEPQIKSFSTQRAAEAWAAAVEGAIVTGTFDNPLPQLRDFKHRRAKALVVRPATKNGGTYRRGEMRVIAARAK